MPNISEHLHGVGRARRNFIKAAAVAVGALTAASVRAKSALAQPTPVPPNGGNTCFLRGTKIMTSAGYRNIESLAVGDVVPARLGGMTSIKSIRISRGPLR